ncbi:glycosyltransferase [Cytobacillus sp. S13-E01]|uniref:MGDG synthase family glycosyltransferase n=1 Tax=Cytobacillus sp. S13-E01 TaxID=3031326 RepID=UPI0023D7E988|nr:glycosyltransferase [Cytobacillus sp. S13-E01]MDF0725719.1 glycosyltransferase [Cytobacillus sp. S13-E01]
MKKVLFLPFLQIPSGHHQVADALREDLEQLNTNVICEKIDILHYGYGKLEALVSSIYLKWIHYSPGSYSWLYKRSVYNGLNNQKNYRLYEFLFMYFIKKMLTERKPDIVVCSHALPSYMLDHLKRQGIIKVPVINVYTDFFIHSFWGTQHIDYHFVSHRHMKDYLLQKGISSEKIQVTGIPLHHKIVKNEIKDFTQKDQYECTIMGGSLGVGAIEELLKKLGPTGKVHYVILCGKNNRLYEQLKQLKLPFIKPMPYISSRAEMDEIYERSDFIITKPGGVTISECLMKGIPIFIYHALPGQEEINLNQLEKLGVVFPLIDWHSNDQLEQHLLSHFDDKDRLVKYRHSLNHYHDEFSIEPAANIINKLLHHL